MLSLYYLRWCNINREQGYLLISLSKIFNTRNFYIYTFKFYIINNTVIYVIFYIYSTTASSFICPKSVGTTISRYNWKRLFINPCFLYANYFWRIYFFI